MSHHGFVVRSQLAGRLTWLVVQARSGFDRIPQPRLQPDPRIPPKAQSIPIPDLPQGWKVVPSNGPQVHSLPLDH